jgi:hypothetical protein
MNMKATTTMAVVLAAMMVALGCEPVDDDDSGGTSRYADCMDMFMQGMPAAMKCYDIPYDDEAKEEALRQFNSVCSIQCGAGMDEEEKGDYHDDAVACGKSTEWKMNEDTGECEASMSEEACSPLDEWLSCLED